MSPSMVAERNVPYGIPTIGEAMLMKVFGKVGVILRNSMKLKRCAFRLATSALKNWSLPGHIHKASGRPTSLDRKKQQDAPALALKMTTIMPRMGPNSEPARSDITIVPGIMNVCMKM